MFIYSIVLLFYNFAFLMLFYCDVFLIFVGIIVVIK